MTVFRIDPPAGCPTSEGRRDDEKHLSHRGDRRLGVRRTLASAWSPLAAGACWPQRRRSPVRSPAGPAGRDGSPCRAGSAVGKLTPSGCTTTGTHAAL